MFIAGGGLAGLTLARQLQLEAPSLRVLVAEKRQHPVREAAFKVGESSVEIGAHYFQQHARPRAAPAQRASSKSSACAISSRSGDNGDLSHALRARAAAFPPVPSFQLDRGRLENMLLATIARSRRRGARRLRGAAIDARRATHTKSSSQRRRASATVTARWVVDASGRAGLAEAPARAGAPSRRTAPTRAGSASRRACASTTGPTTPHGRRACRRGQRWLSTNHLMGRATGSG